jgi:hypothetical protein
MYTSAGPPNARNASSTDARAISACKQSRTKRAWWETKRNVHVKIHAVIDFRRCDPQHLSPRGALAHGERLRRGAWQRVARNRHQTRDAKKGEWEVLRVRCCDSEEASARGHVPLIAAWA